MQKELKGYNPEILAVRDRAINRVTKILEGIGPALQPAFTKLITQPMDGDAKYNLVTEQNGHVVTEYADGGNLERTIIFDSNGRMRVWWEDTAVKIEATMNSPDFSDEYMVEFESSGSAGPCLAFSGANNEFYRALARVEMGFRANFWERRIIRNTGDRGLLQGSYINCRQNDKPFDREVRQEGDGQIYLHVFETIPNGFRICDQQLPQRD